MAKGDIARYEQFLLLFDYVFKKSSAAEASESVYMRERVNPFQWTDYFGHICIRIKCRKREICCMWERVINNNKKESFHKFAYMFSKSTASVLSYFGKGLK